MREKPVPAVALLPRETPDIQMAVARLMEPFDLNTRVAPYKSYLSEQQLKVFATRWGISVYDRPALAAHINESYERTASRYALRHRLQFQADALGIYYMTEENPNGKYRRWSLNSLTDDVWPVSAMPRDLVPHVVITPDGQWHELFPKDWEWGRVPVEHHRERLVREAYEIIDRYPEHLAARLEVYYHEAVS